MVSRPPTARSCTPTCKGINTDSGKPYSYRRTEDFFLLYSFGANLKDDGGEVARDEKGKIKKWANEGAWVFWPAEES